MRASRSLLSSGDAPRVPDEAGAEPADAAYGLRFPGLEGAARVLVTAPSWPPVEIRLQRGTVDARGPDTCDEHHARFFFRTGGQVVLERNPPRATLTLPQPPDLEGLVHPFLFSTAAMSNRWLGRETFHAGGFVANGGAWGVLGHRGLGKSSLLGWLATHGLGIVSDDLLVVESGTAYAGPRMIDLRAEAARELRIGESIGVLGVRERWRLPIAPVPVELPFKGWVFLDWGEHMAIERLSIATVLSRLAEHRALRLPFLDAVRLLDLAALPSFTLVRPQRWEEIGPASRLLLDRLESLSVDDRPRSPATPPEAGGRS